MAIRKSGAEVPAIRVAGDGTVMATVVIDFLEDGENVGTTRKEILVKNATNAEKTAAASLVSKAQALADA